jgi:hypothetical protein
MYQGELRDYNNGVRIDTSLLFTQDYNHTDYNNWEQIITASFLIFCILWTVELLSCELLVV